MAKLSKRTQAIRKKVDTQKVYPVADALKLVKDCATAKFDESVDVSVQLGIDAKKSDQAVRGSVVLPAGSGKTKRVAVFAQGAKAEEAKAAGADIVGFDDLAAKVETVTPDVAQAVKNAKAGQVQFRADKAGIVHASIGRASFDVERLNTNLTALIDALNKSKPASAKGVFLRKVSVSSTMGIGVRVDAGTLHA